MIPQDHHNTNSEKWKPTIIPTYARDGTSPALPNADVRPFTTTAPLNTSDGISVHTVHVFERSNSRPWWLPASPPSCSSPWRPSSWPPHRRRSSWRLRLRRRRDQSLERPPLRPPLSPWCRPHCCPCLWRPWCSRSIYHLPLMYATHGHGHGVVGFVSRFDLSGNLIECCCSSFFLYHIYLRHSYIYIWINVGRSIAYFLWIFFLGLLRIRSFFFLLSAQLLTLCCHC